MTLDGTLRTEPSDGLRWIAGLIYLLEVATVAVAIALQSAERSSFCSSICFLRSRFLFLISLLSLSLMCSTNNAHIMAQKMKTKVEIILGIPVTVEYRAAVSKWEIKPHPDVWESQAGVQVHPERFFESNLVREMSGPFDAWKVREEFLSLKADRQFLDFLNTVGPFAEAPGWLSGQWAASDFKLWQEMFREFLKRSPASWDCAVEKVFKTKTVSVVGQILGRAKRFTLLFHWKGKQEVIEWRGAQHIAALEAKDVVTAILATIYVDHLHGTKFGFCKRDDCRKAYRIESKHIRKYCSQYCAHLESLRRMRARSRKRLKTDRAHLKK